MSVLIPTPTSLPFFDVQVNLEGTTYTLQCRWNPRAPGWFVDVLNEQGTMILLAGLRLVVNFPLAAYVTGRQPAGAFIAVDTSGQGLDPGLDDLGDRVKLHYFSAAELGL